MSVSIVQARAYPEYNDLVHELPLYEQAGMLITYLFGNGLMSAVNEYSLSATAPLVKF